MTNDVAIYLDLDNLVIGAKQANVSFDINLVLEHIKEITEGRIVLRNAYGAGRQNQTLMQELAQAGFIVQSATRINNFGKNLADMQIVVNAMDTLVDGHQYETYVLMSGDRDFTPLVQSLRKRGKRVIGVGIRHTTSSSLAELCDRFIFYEDLLVQDGLSEEEMENLLVRARDTLLHDKKQVRASVLKQRMMELSQGRFNTKTYPESNFRKFLQQYPHQIQTRQDGTTIYALKPAPSEPEPPLYQQYRTKLKKQRLRIVPPNQRFVIMKDLLNLLNERSDLLWRDVLAALADGHKEDQKVASSKNMVNAVMLLAREANIIRTLQGKSLSTAPVLLSLEGDHTFQDAIIRSDIAYIRAISNLPEPFDVKEVALALYENEKFVPYLYKIIRTADLPIADATLVA